MPRRLAAVLLAASACAAYASAQPADEPDESGAIEARLTDVQGPVYVHYADAPEGEFQAAEADSPLEEGDVVRTGEGAQAEIGLDGASVVTVAENSDFAVSSLDKKDARFDLGIGSFVAKLKKLLPGQNLQFRTVTAVAAVRGTELGMSQDGDDQPAHVGVFDEGHVLVQSQGRGGFVPLDPGQETEVSKGAAPSKPAPLRALAGHRSFLQNIRRRQSLLSQTWRPRPRSQRLQMRRRLLQRPRMKGQQLRGVRPDRANRRMARRQRKQQRQQEKQQRHEQRRRQMQQRRQQLQQNQQKRRRRKP